MKRKLFQHAAASNDKATAHECASPTGDNHWPRESWSTGAVRGAGAAVRSNGIFSIDSSTSLLINSDSSWLEGLWWHYRLLITIICDDVRVRTFSVALGRRTLQRIQYYVSCPWCHDYVRCMVAKWREWTQI
jgi:hypothetical protein